MGKAIPAPPTGPPAASVATAQPPMRTVGWPTTIGAPQPARSPTRAAGRPPISTDVEPGGTMTDGGCTAGGGNEQMCGVPTVAAGSPPISTFGTPGGPMTPGWPVGSPTRAAGFMLAPLLVG